MMKLLMKKYGWILIALALFGQVHALEVGDMAAEFTFVSLSGDTISLSDFEGKVLFIFVFGVKCPYCLDIGNDTETKVYQIFKNHEDFAAIGIDTWDFYSSVANMLTFKATTGITYPLLLKGGSFETLYNTTYDRIIIIDKDGKIAFKGTSVVSSTLNAAIAVLQTLLNPTGIDDKKSMQPGTFSLGQNYPNPFNPETVVGYSVPNRTRTGQLSVVSEIQIDIYDAMGQFVKQLFSGLQSPGYHEVVWDGTDAYGRNVASGIYLYQLKTNEKVMTKRMVLAR